MSAAIKECTECGELYDPLELVDNPEKPVDHLSFCCQECEAQWADEMEDYE